MSKTKAHTKYRSKAQTYKNGKGIIFPGVTTITGILAKPALVKWANNLGLQGIDSTKYVDDKADIGTLAHAIIINDLLGKITDKSDYTQNQIDQAENAALSFWEWYKSHKIQIVIAEEPLISEEHEYGGILDIYGSIDGFLELLDLKTGSGIYSEHLTQVGGAYRHLLVENNHEVQRVRILNIPRTESENWQEVVVEPKVCDAHWELFKHCLAIYKLKKQLKSGFIMPDRKEKK